MAETNMRGHYIIGCTGPSFIAVEGSTGLSAGTI
jgi:hypothetical protein